MKKLLLTSAASLALLASSAVADMPEVKVGGSFDFMAASSKQKKVYKDQHLSGLTNVGASNADIKFHSRNNKNFSLASKTKVFVKAEGKGDNGIIYGAVVMLTPTSNQATGYSNGKEDRTFGYVESNMGRVEFGSNYGVSRMMKVDAGSIAAATGGASDGDWSDFVMLPSTSATHKVADTFFNRSLSHSKGESSRKVTWFSPRYNGFQFGLSYTPDAAMTGSGHTDSSFNGNWLQYVKNVVNYGVNYSAQMNNVNVAFSFTGDVGKAVDRSLAGATMKYNKLRSYQFGGAVNSGNFTFAGSYGTDGKSLSVRNTLGNESKHFTLGAAYEMGASKLSLTYFNAKYGRKNTFSHVKTSAFTLGADYNLAAGIKTYAEFTSYSVKPNALFTLGGKNGPKNAGSVFILGTKVKF